MAGTWALVRSAAGSMRSVLGRFTPRRRVLAVSIAGVALLGGTLGTLEAPWATASPSIRADAASCPWLTSSGSIQSRVTQLLGAMTLGQKIGLINLNTGSGYENVTPAIPNLCVPALVLQDGPTGVTAGAGAGTNGAGTATQMPAPIALAASFDPGLAASYGQVLGNEALAKGIDAVQAPDVNIARVPQAGRDFEVFGEDPYLAAQTAVGEIDGIQSTGEMSVIKHFAAYNQETNRGTEVGDDSIVSPQALQEIYFPAFQAAVQQARVASVMCSYNQVNGVAACQSATLLKDVLDDQWGFAGFVRSDLGAVWDQSAALAGGLDQFKPAAASAIQAGVTNGSIPVADINDAVGRVLTEMFRFNVFSRVLSGTATTQASTAADQAVAVATNEEGAVLLQNNGGALPLPRTAGERIEVLGDDAGAAVQTGPTDVSSAYVQPSSLVTPCQGLTAAAGSATVNCDTSWNPTSPSDASSQASQEASEAQSADAAVIFVSLPAGEGADLTSLELPDYQDTLIQTVAASQPNTIVVVNSGNPVTMPWLSGVRSVVEDWFGGQGEGTAIAALLYGDTNFSGKLPITFPTSTASTPTSSPAQFPGINGSVQYSEGIDVGYRGYEADGITPEFPFGFGLSYTSFSYSPVTLSRTRVANDTFAPNPQSGQSAPLLSASVTVTNTGRLTGTDVAQLYVADPASTGEQRQLEGDQRVTLAPGASQTLVFQINARDLSYWNATAEGWVVPDGGYTVYAGDSSALANLPSQASFSVVRSVGARYGTLHLPTAAAAGTTIKAVAYFDNWGDDTMYRPHFSLAVPAAYRVSHTWKTVTRIPPHTQVRRIFSVTVPLRAQGTSPSLTAQLRYAATPGTVARSTLTASAPTTFGGVVTTTARSVTVDPGGSYPTKLSFANPGTTPVQVSWRAYAPAGVTITPSAGTVTVRHRGRALYLNVRATTTAGAGYAPIDVDVKGSVTTVTVRHVKVGTTYRVVRTRHVIRYYLPGTQVPVMVAYPSLAAAFNDTGVTDSDAAAGNFDGYGNSYSASALAAVGITPGSTVSAYGLDFTWPSAGPDVPDEVLSSGQTVAVGGAGTVLGLLGAGTGGNPSGTVTVRYTDGTTSSAFVRFTNWTTSTPVPSDQLVANTNAENRTDGAPPQPVSLYATTVPLVPGKAVAQVTLPTPSPNQTMHVFALAIG